MKTKHSEHIIILLTELSQELKAAKLWQDHSPSADELSSQAPFCCDTLAFEQWLQFIFIPKITLLIKQQDYLPNKISLTPMAEEVFKHLPAKAESLLSVITKIDQAMTASGVSSC